MEYYYYLTVNPKYTNVNLYKDYIIENETDIFFFKTGEIIPNVGDICMMYNNKTKRTFLKCLVLEILDKPEYTPIPSDLINTHRRIRPQKGLKIKFVEFVDQPINLSNLIGSRLQSIIKIMVESDIGLNEEFTINEYLETNYNPTCLKTRIIDFFLDKNF